MIAVLAAGTTVSMVLVSVYITLVTAPLAVPNIAHLVSSEIRVSAPDLRAIERSPSFAAAAAVFPIRVVTQSDTADEVRHAALATANLFDMLGVRLAAGRPFTVSEAASSQRVAVVSAAFWATRRAAFASLDDARITVNGRAYRIVGVLPAPFKGLSIDLPVDLWLPFEADAPERDQGHLLPQTPQHAWLRWVGRLRPGGSLAQARNDVAQALRRTGLAEHEKVRLVQPLATVAIPRGVREASQRSLQTLQLLTTLLFGLSLVSGLLLAWLQAMARRQAAAIRLFHGATKTRLIGAYAAEGALLGLLAGVVSLLPVAMVLQSFEGIRIARFVALTIPFGMSGATAALSLGLGAVMGAWCAGLAGLLAWRGPVQETLTRAGHLTPPRLTGRYITLSSVALASMVSAAASCITVIAIQHLTTLTRAPLGLTRESLGWLVFDMHLGHRSEEERLQFLIDVAQAAEGVPGVLFAGLSSSVPLGDIGYAWSVKPLGGTVTEERDLFGSLVSPGYFDAVGLAIERGRRFTSVSTRTEVIVNRSAAALLFPEADAVGHSLAVTSTGGRLTMNIVGIAADSSYFAPGEGPRPQVYLPFALEADPIRVLLVRSSGRLDAILETVGRITREHGSVIPVLDTMTMERHVDWHLARPRLLATITVVIGGLSAALAFVNAFCAGDFIARTRRYELAVRSVIGATPMALAWVVVSQVVGAAAGGALAGVWLGMAGGRLLSMGTAASGLDAYSSAALAAVLTIATVLLATWGPTRRAAHMMPSVVLRSVN